MSALEALAGGRPAPGTAVGRRTGRGEVVFVFPGPGRAVARAWGGRSSRASPVFRDRMVACERRWRRHVDWSLTAVLRGEGAEDGEPALGARRRRAAGAVRGHGRARRAVALAGRRAGRRHRPQPGRDRGRLRRRRASLEDAAAIVALRSRALARLAGTGAMAAVELGAGRAGGPSWRRSAIRLAIAGAQQPARLAGLGEPAAVDALLGALAAAGVFARRVRVDYASHGPQVEAVRDELAAGLAGVAPRAAGDPDVLDGDGRAMDGAELDGGYWYRNLRQTVRFADTARRPRRRGLPRVRRGQPAPGARAGARRDARARGRAGHRRGLAPARRRRSRRACWPRSAGCTAGGHDVDLRACFGRGGAARAWSCRRTRSSASGSGATPTARRDDGAAKKERRRPARAGTATTARGRCSAALEADAPESWPGCADVAGRTGCATCTRWCWRRWPPCSATSDAAALDLHRGFFDQGIDSPTAVELPASGSSAPPASRSPPPSRSIIRRPTASRRTPPRRSPPRSHRRALAPDGRPPPDGARAAPHAHDARSDPPARGGGGGTRGRRRADRDRRPGAPHAGRRRGRGRPLAPARGRDRRGRPDPGEPLERGRGL